jgi:preprotein translocase subunit SecY
VLESLRNIFAIPDLRKRVMFTFALLAVYRVGCHIPTPGIDPKALIDFMNAIQSSFLGFVNTFTGGSLERVAVFALGIMPYITASIILQLLTVVVPYLEKLSKEGELGRKKITQYTRYGTVLVSVIQSTGIALFLEKTTTPTGAVLVPSPGWGFRLMTILTLTTGCAFVMWLGEQISERGVGNGISLIIFAGIVVGLPGAVADTIARIAQDELSIVGMVLLTGFMVAVVAFIVYMERAQRRIPVQYAKRMVGRKVYGGQSTYLPLRVNTGGVIPVIFASSLMALPATFAQMLQVEWMQRIADALAWGQPLHYLLYIVGIIFFCSIRRISPRTCGSTAASSPGSDRESARRSTSTGS